MGGPCPEELVKDVGQVGWRYANPGVTDLAKDLAIRSMNLDGYGTIVRVLDGIINQILPYLRDQARVRLNMGNFLQISRRK